MKFEQFNKQEEVDNKEKGTEEDKEQFKEKKLSFKERRELKKIQDILDKQIEMDNTRDKGEVEDDLKQGENSSEKRVSRQEAYEELEKDKEGGNINVEKTLQRLNKEKNKEAKEKVWESLTYSNARKSISIAKEWRARKEGLRALSKTELKSDDERIQVYVDSYLKKVPFIKTDTEHTREVVINMIKGEAKKYIDLNADEIKKQAEKVDGNYIEMDKKMLRFRELMVKKYFQDDEKKQGEIKEWEKDLEDEITRSGSL